MKKFISTERKGFKMTFENGLTVSVQWGLNNYCDNKIFTSEDLNNADFSHIFDASSNTAEVAIMIDDVFIEPYRLGIDDSTSPIIGYRSPEEVLDIMVQVRNCNINLVESIKSQIHILSKTYPVV
jgi:hypothetical protein